MENLNNLDSSSTSINTNQNYLPPERNLIKLIIVILIFCFSIALFIVSVSLQKSRISKIKTDVTTETENYRDEQLKPGWSKYRNDVLGIEFQYPTKWGDIYLLPTNNITHLKNINKEFLNLTDNDLRYMVILNFSQNSSISVNFINNEYKGENYPNGYAYKYGPMDNFSELVKTENICNYHFNFQNEVYGRNVKYLESDNKCQDSIKTTLFFENPDNVNGSGSRYYNYLIKQYFFKKLNNNYFDNLLIKNNIAFYQGIESTLNFEQVIQKDINPELFKSSTSDFEEFTKSIKSFSPPTPTPITFIQNAQEDPNITTIRQYYFYLATQKLQDAYNMYQNKNIVFEEFNNWYNQVFNTHLYNIKKINTNTYIFDVDLSEQNKGIAKYRVTMKVENNKLKTLSSEQIVSKEVKFNNLTAYSRVKNNLNQIVLIKDGQEIIIESADNDYSNKIGTTKTFSNPRFSPLGNYLIYSVGGWEYSGGKVYDIKNLKIMKDVSINYPKFFEISENEKYIYSCSQSEMGGEYGAAIYSLADYQKQFDFLKSSGYSINRKCVNNFGNEETFMCDIYECNINNNIAEFTIKSQDFVKPEYQKNLIMKFNLNTGQLVQ